MANARYSKKNRFILVKLFYSRENVYFQVSIIYF